MLISMSAISLRPNLKSLTGDKVDSGQKVNGTQEGEFFTEEKIFISFAML
jgi:hypothetical protein